MDIASNGRFLGQSLCHTRPNRALLVEIGQLFARPVCCYGQRCRLLDKSEKHGTVWGLRGDYTTAEVEWVSLVSVLFLFFLATCSAWPFVLQSLFVHDTGSNTIAANRIDGSPIRSRITCCTTHIVTRQRAPKAAPTLVKQRRAHANQQEQCPDQIPSTFQRVCTPSSFVEFIQKHGVSILRFHSQRPVGKASPLRNCNRCSALGFTMIFSATWCEQVL